MFFFNFFFLCINTERGKQPSSKKNEHKKVLCPARSLSSYFGLKSYKKVQGLQLSEHQGNEDHLEDVIRDQE